MDQLLEAGRETGGFVEAPRARVVRDLKQWIEDGVVLRGQPLPSERILSEKLGVTRDTIRRALVLLEQDGFLRSENGRARIVTAPERRRSGLMAETVAVLTTVEGGTWLEYRPAGWTAFIAQGAIHAIRESGLHALALHPKRFAGEGIQNLMSECPYGVVLTDIPGRTAETINWAKTLRSGGLATVVCGSSPALADFDRVISNHESGSYQLARWLLEQGRRKIALAWHGTPSSYWYPARRAGYERALRESGLEPLPTIFVDFAEDTQLEPGAAFRNKVARTAHLLKHHVGGTQGLDALMLDTDGITPFFASALRQLGANPESDVVLAGYDNYWEELPDRQFDNTAPAATVDKQNLKLGAELASLLIERVERRLPLQAQCRCIEPKLVVPAKR